MKVQIQSVKFDADQRLVDFIQHKMDKMDRFVEGVLSAQVNLKVDKDDELGNKVAVVKWMSPAANWLPNVVAKLLKKRSISVSTLLKSRSISIKRNTVRKNGRYRGRPSDSGGRFSFCSKIHIFVQTVA